MTDQKPCIKCGGTSFGEGETKGEGNAYPKNKLFGGSSKIILTICTNCGEVISRKL